jgi:signal transduction histidine kinase
MDPTDEAKILAVDDTPANLLVLRALLEPVGHTIVEAGSGREALARAAESEFALLLLDVMMPEMDGFETLARLRQLPSFEGTPVMFLSAYDPEPPDVRNAFALGVVDYMLKPIVPAVLRAKVQIFVDLYRRGLQLRRRNAALAARDRQIGILAHDLRTPLTSIKLSAQALARNGGSPRQDQAARIIRAVSRMERMTEDLLDFARVEAGELQIKPTDMDVASVSREALDELTASAPERPIDLEFQGDLRGHWDRERIHQALSNLLGNAIKYGETRITVRARGLERHVELAIWNDGEPIPTDRLTRVFEPFQRGQQGGQGLGLGLYIAQQIALSHGGGIEVASARGVGTTFTMRLPRLR